MELPVDFKKRMTELLGEEYGQFEEAFSADEEYVGIRIVKKNAEKLVLAALDDAASVPWCKNGYYTSKAVISGKHPYHAAGAVYFQEPSAMLPVAALPIEKNDYVLDLCAAPGGKSTQALEKLGEDGLLVANEIVPKRAQILAENIDRCGGKNAVVTNEEPEALAKRFPEFFDKIIVDAPCSGEGMFRKEPQAIAEWSEAHTLSCAQRQRHIIDSAIKMLRPGGMMVYSTCTFSPDENEKLVDYILSEYAEMSLVPIETVGASDGIGGFSEHDMSSTKRIFPHRARGEGHFAALLKKDGTSERHMATGHNLPPSVFAEFEKDTFFSEHKGYFHTFGEKLYLLPTKLSFDKIRVIRPGLYLGDVKKGRFEPSYALSHAHGAEDFMKIIDLPSECDDVKKYLHGDVISCESVGWVCVSADGLPLGWGKASGGMLKNHFPKKLRL